MVDWTVEFPLGWVLWACPLLNFAKLWIDYGADTKYHRFVMLHKWKYRPLNSFTWTWFEFIQLLWQTLYKNLGNVWIYQNLGLKGQKLSKFVPIRWQIAPTIPNYQLYWNLDLKNAQFWQKNGLFVRKNCPNYYLSGVTTGGSRHEWESNPSTGSIHRLPFESWAEQRGWRYPPWSSRAATAPNSRADPLKVPSVSCSSIVRWDGRMRPSRRATPARDRDPPHSLALSSVDRTYRHYKYHKSQ